MPVLLKVNRNLMAYDVFQHLEQLKRLLESNIPFVVVTMVDIRGSAPQIQGAKAIVTANGVVSGTIGGGKIEAQAISRSQEMLASQQPRGCEFEVWNLQTDIGMTCGGEVKLFFEPHLSNDWELAIFGAGHIAQAVIPLLLGMNCRITWVDQRAEWLARGPEHAKLRKVQCENLTDALSGISERSFIVLMTQGHATDLPVLENVLLHRRSPYVGVLGSLQKAKAIARDLREHGLSEELLKQFHCPMGLPLGNNTPAEIAISIVGQLIQERDRLGIVDHKTKAFKPKD